jgi:GxxExxY protein
VGRVGKCCGYFVNITKIPATVASRAVREGEWIDCKSRRLSRFAEPGRQVRPERKVLAMEINELTAKIIGAAIAVHKELGPGLLESVYQRCMVLELRSMGMKVESEVPVPVWYRGQNVSDDGLRLDLLVDGDVIVELKSVEEIKPIHKKQLLTYLRITKKTVGLLINFNEVQLRSGITRIVSNYKDEG